MTFVLSMACALLAALSYGTASVMQAAAARRTGTRPNLDALLLVRLARQVPYLAGLALDLVGFASSVVALRNLPLFVVQSAVAGSVGVTAITAALAFGFSLRRYETVALVVLVAGFALLAVSAQPEHATTLSRHGRWLLVAGIGLVVIVGYVSARRHERAASVGLAIGAGLSWAGTGIAARVLHVPTPLWHVIIDPVAIVLAVYGVLGTLLFATALQRGSVTAAAALVFSVETVVPSGIGLAFLGDHARPHFLTAALAGVVASVGASITLARRSEPLPPRIAADTGVRRQTR